MSIFSASNLNADAMLHSACFTRVGSTIAVLRLQLLLSTQFTEQECLGWGSSLWGDVQESDIFKTVEPILNRLVSEPEFALGDLRHGAIASGILTFTSAVEYYLKDVILLSLRRHSGLRKEALKGFSIPALDLEKFDNLNDIKLKYFDSLSSEHSKGGLFSNKIKKASSFLSVDEKVFDKEILTKVDSVWALRNRMAHQNQVTIKEYQVNGIGDGSKITREATKADYSKFILGLVSVVNDTVERIGIWDQSVMTKWPANNLIIE